MNQIYWGKDRISMVTDSIEASEHSHCMLQIFLSYQETLNINISGQDINCRLVIVNKNIPHSFSTENKIHYTSLIEPASSFANYLEKLMEEKEYLIIDVDKISQLQKLLSCFISNNQSISNYHIFLNLLHEVLGYKNNSIVFDDRIKKCLTLIEECSCIDEHKITFFAKKISLSTSRLSHLFRAQVGIPLKSFILLHQMKKSLLKLIEGHNITDAAYKSGFDSPSHFAYTIKKMTGMTASSATKNISFILDV